MASPMSGIEPDFLEQLKKIIAAQMSPSPADQKSAQARALMTTGLGILATPGNWQQQVGKGGLLGLNSYNDEIKQMQQQRAANLAAAAGTYKLGKDAQLTDMGIKQYQNYIASQGGGGQAAPQADASSLPSGSLGASFMPPPPIGGGGSQPSQRQALGNLALAQGVAKGDIGKALDFLFKPATSMRADAGYMDETTNTFHPGMKAPPGYIWNPQTQKLQKIEGGPEAFASNAGAVTDAQAQATSEHKLIPVPMGDGTTQMMTEADAVSFLQSKRNVGGPGQSINVQGASPQQISQMQADIASGGKVFSPVGPQQRMGATPNPVAMKAAEAEASKSGENLGTQATAVDTEARAAQDMLARTQEMRNLLKYMKTGAASPARLEVGKWAQAAGLPDSVSNTIAGGDVGAMQAMGKQAVQGAFAAARQALGTGQRITQSEVLTMAQNSPNVSLTKEAINAMLDFQEGIGRWQVEKQAAKEAWVNGNGSYKGFETDWNKNHPLTQYVPSKEQLESVLFPNGMPKSADSAAPTASAPKLSAQAQGNATARAMLQKEIAEGNPEVLAKRRAQGWIE